MVIIGAFIAITLQLSGVQALAFSVGVYLPLETSMPIFIGGLVRLLVEKVRKSKAEDSDSSPAVLLASGYIAGGAIAGTLLAFLNFPVLKKIARAMDLSANFPGWYNDSPLPAVIAFGVLAFVLALVGLGLFLKDREPKDVEKGTTVRDEFV
jgi:hypothetical protein